MRILEDGAQQNLETHHELLGSSGGVFHNSPLLVAIMCFIVAQTAKFFINWWETKQWHYERLVGSGGMPSAHSAFVMGLATSVGIRDGTSSSTFAIALVLACIVMYDAVGLRLHAGRHATALNIIISELPPDHPVTMSTPGQLRESLGHTPAQVAAGAILGFVLAFITQSLISRAG